MENQKLKIIKNKVLKLDKPNILELGVQKGNSTNMFLDDDLWFAIYLYCEKKTYIKNLIDEFNKETNN